MAKNRHPNVGAYIQTTAAQVMELGDRGYGTLKSEFQTNCSWALDPYMERQLTGTSDFSYTQLGDDAHPITVFLVPPRGDAALRAALPWLRSHAELEACSTMQYYAINDLATATRISERLGYTTLKQHNVVTGKTEYQVAQVISPDEVLRELSLTSPLSYVMGGGVMPMRLRRIAFKRIVTREGTRFDGLPLEGQYDEGLSRYLYGG